MHKKYILLIILLLLFIGGIYFWMEYNRMGASPTIPTGKEIQVVTKESAVSIPVDNFYQKSTTKVFDSQKDATLNENDKYSLTYNTIDQSFFIVLGDSNNLQAARVSGEQELLQQLNISKDQACKLRVSVTVPLSVSEQAAGVDYGLSFCSNGKALPVAP